MATPDTVTYDNSEIRLVVEKLRLMGYASFWCVVMTGYLLTRLFSDLDLQDSHLMHVFGYNNICVYFDYPPSTYVLPMLWAFTLVILLIYIVTHWLHMKAELKLGRLTPGLYKTLSGLKAFEAIALISFSTSFAVSPEDHNHTMFVHTLPFFLLQLGLVSLAMSNTLHGIKSGYWRRLGLPSWFTSGAVIYCIIFAIIVAFKIPVAANALTGGLWWVQSTSLIDLAKLLDQLFFVFAAMIPMVKAMYLLLTRANKLDMVVLTPGIRAQ